MNKELEKQLVEKYPEIFADVNKNPSESGMTFGIQTGDGWYWLIDQICNRLQKCEEQIRAFQVKQKFGGLRFYLVGKVTPSLMAIIEFAQTLSLSICEDCGSMDTVSQREGSWIRTLCDTCENKNK